MRCNFGRSRVASILLMGLLIRDQALPGATKKAPAAFTAFSDNSIVFGTIADGR